MTKTTTKATTEETAEPTFENTLQHYSYAPLVELAVKLAGRIKAAKDRRADPAPSRDFDSTGQHRPAKAAQARAAKPVSSPQH